MAKSSRAAEAGETSAGRLSRTGSASCGSSGLALGCFRACFEGLSDRVTCCRADWLTIKTTSVALWSCVTLSRPGMRRRKATKRK